MSPAALWDLSDKVIAACIEVHRHLGPGLLESAYEAALCEELRSRGIPFRRQCNFPVIYTDKTLDQTHRIDPIAAERLVVEVKAVEALLPVHAAQMLTYLRLTGLECGLLVNFNTELIRHRLRRLSLTPKILASRTSRLPASL